MRAGTRFRSRRRDAPSAEESVAPDDGLTPADRAIFERVRPFTLTSPTRVQALLDAVEYCARRGIPETAK